MTHLVSPVLTDLREHRPLVQCLTNAVATALTAQVVQCVGGSPAMVDTPAEAGAFARVADGMLINLGTPTRDGYQAMTQAAAHANAWVLDPIGAGTLTERDAFARRLLADAEHRPAVIRGNASEVAALLGVDGAARGTESTIDPLSILEPAQAYSLETGIILAISGPEDLIISADRATVLTAGHPLLPQIVGSGCSLGAVVAAYIGAAGATHTAVLAAHAHVGAAATLAATHATGPGSFLVAWLDALATPDATLFDAHAVAKEL